MPLSPHTPEPFDGPAPRFSAEPLAQALRACLNATAWSRALVDLTPDLEAFRDLVGPLLRMIEEVERFPEDLQENLVLLGWAGTHLRGAPDIVPPQWSSTPSSDTTGEQR